MSRTLLNGIWKSLHSVLSYILQSFIGICLVLQNKQINQPKKEKRLYSNITQNNVSVTHNSWLLFVVNNEIQETWMHNVNSSSNQKASLTDWEGKREGWEKGIKEETLTCFSPSILLSACWTASRYLKCNSISRSTWRENEIERSRKKEDTTKRSKSRMKLCEHIWKNSNRDKQIPPS